MSNEPAGFPQLTGENPAACVQIQPFSLQKQTAVRTGVANAVGVQPSDVTLEIQRVFGSQVGQHVLHRLDANIYKMQLASSLLLGPILGRIKSGRHLSRL